MRQMFRDNKGQSLIEALFVVIFTTIIMFAFIQVCIIVVDDMLANEAAFVALRSAVVTKSKYRVKEAESRVKNYIMFFYPAVIFGVSNFNPSHFVLSTKKNVEEYFNQTDEYGKDNSEEITDDGNSLDSENRSISIWKGKKRRKIIPVKR